MSSIARRFVVGTLHRPTHLCDGGIPELRTSLTRRADRAQRVDRRAAAGRDERPSAHIGTTDAVLSRSNFRARSERSRVNAVIELNPDAIELAEHADALRRAARPIPSSRSSASRSC